MKMEQTQFNQEYKYPRIRVGKEVYDELAYYAEKSGLSLNKVTSELLSFAMEYVSLEPKKVTIHKLKINGEVISDGED